MKKFLFAILIFWFTLPVFAENTILIVGDSLSAGYGLSLGQGWGTLLSKRLQAENYDYRVVNASISGATTSNGLAQLPVLLGQYKPKILIIELGANDGLRGLPIQVIKNNLSNMLALAKKAGCKVLLVGIRLPPNYGPGYTQQFQDIFLTLAKDQNINVVPLFLNHVDDQPGMMQADGTHPNAKAQSVMLETLWVDLKSLLK